MSLKDLKVTDEEFSSYGVISQPDTLTGTPEENKAVFDALIRRVSIEHINKLIDELSTSGAADMGTEPFGAVTATTVQAALEQIYALIGSTYSGTDGAGKVGFSGTSSIQASNVQAAIEAVQANLAALIALLKSQQGAAQVGNAPIAGLTATTVQAALAELRDQIQDIVAGSIPSQSVTTEQIQDGAVTAEKIGFTGEDIPTSDTDSTSISSQLSNLDGEKYTRMVDTPPQSWSEVWALTPHIVYSWVQQTPLAWQPEGTPSGGLRVELTIHNSTDVSGSKSAMLAYIDGVATFTRYVGEEMVTGALNGRWAKLATATPPQEFDLPLAEGISGLAKYSKDQFGRVQLRGWVTGATANSVVATLPSGFRPASGAHFIQAISSSTQNGIACVVVRTDGTVYIEFPQNGALASGLSLQLSFAAAS